MHITCCSDQHYVENDFQLFTSNKIVESKSDDEQSLINLISVPKCIILEKKDLKSFEKSLFYCIKQIDENYLCINPIIAKKKNKKNLNIETESHKELNQTNSSPQSKHAKQPLSTRFKSPQTVRNNIVESNQPIPTQIKKKDVLKANTIIDSMFINPERKEKSSDIKTKKYIERNNKLEKEEKTNEKNKNIVEKKEKVLLLSPKSVVEKKKIEFKPSAMDINLNKAKKLIGSKDPKKPIKSDTKTITISNEEEPRIFPGHIQTPKNQTQKKEKEEEEEFF